MNFHLVSPHSKNMTLKTVLSIELVIAAFILMVTSHVQADELTYSVVQESEIAPLNAGDTFFGPEFNETVGTPISQFEVSGSVTPSPVGLIGVSTSFNAIVATSADGFVPGADDVTNADFQPDLAPFAWDRVTIETTATGAFNSTALITGLSEFNTVGAVQFEWEITGTSQIQLDVDTGVNDVGVLGANTIAQLSSSFGIPDAFTHLPTLGPTIDDFEVASLEQDTIILQFNDANLLSQPNPVFDVDFEFSVSSFLDINSGTVGDGASFTSDFDADFTNTARLASITVFDTAGDVIEGAQVVDSITLQSLVVAPAPASVPEPATAMILVFAGCVAGVRRRRVS